MVVCDASALIDLRKAQLQYATMGLSYRFSVPIKILDEELLKFGSRELRLLAEAGLEDYTLSASEAIQATFLRGQHRRLSMNDCAAFAIATHHVGSVLLTGDEKLKKAAKNHGVRVHGVLWIVDELRINEVCGKDILASALKIWRGSNYVYLPKDENDERLSQLNGAD